MKNMVYLIKKAWYFAWHRHHLLIPLPVLKNYIRSFFRILKRGGIGKNIFTSPDSYNEWRKSHEIKPVDCKYKDIISIVYPIIEYDEEKIKDTIDSIYNQKYHNIQLIIVADDRYYSKITQYTNKNTIVINTKTKRGINYLYNKGIETAKGNYICFVNSNLILEKEAINYIGKCISDNKVDIIYTDEDHINDKKVLYGPIFKPDWSLDSFLGENYFGSFLVIRNDIINQVGDLTSKYHQNTFKDFYLKCISKSNSIKHISQILFHDYEHQCDSKDDKNLLEDYLKYNNIKADILKTNDYDGYVIKYHHHNPLVSIIIPFKNQFNYTKNCIESLTKKLSYRNYEIILVDNGTTDEKMLNWLKDVSRKNKRIKLFANPIEFNFSKLCNYGAQHSNGDYYLFLNNDIELINGDFLDWMVGYASLKDVGAVGLKLLYKDRLVQHMGVIISYGGYAGHYGVAHNETEKGHYSMCVRPYNFSAVTAACLLVSKEKFHQIKGFDEKLGVALNDVDLCLKLLDSGYRNVCLNNIKMFHFESKSRGYDDNKAKSERYKKEQEYLKNKWKDTLNMDRYYNENYF